MLANRSAALVLGLLIGCVCSTVTAADWQYQVETDRPARKGKPQSSAIGNLWLPGGVKQVRGLVLGGKTLLERQILTDSRIRKAAAEKGLGVLYFEPALDAVFNYVENDSGRRLEQALKELANKSKHPELEHAPLLTVGHSTGGIFCRNVAFWKPERVIGVIHIKSGNFQDGVWDESRSLAGVPFLAINGEFEDCGPAGGDLGRGLRAEYSLDEKDKKRKNQTQWVMIRMQMMARRAKNPDNLMSLVIHRGGGHTDWDGRLSALCAQFIRGATDARIPSDPPQEKTVQCNTLAARDGWLSDADIKSPQFATAAHADFAGDKKLAFWHVDQSMAEAIDKYHAGNWDHADPTAGQPNSKRYVPPVILRDKVDQ
jgi:hypothetical protein